MNLNESKANGLDKIMSRQEVADYFGVSLVTLYNWTKQNRIKSVGIGRRVYYKMSDVQKSIVEL